MSTFARYFAVMRTPPLTKRGPSALYIDMSTAAAAPNEIAAFNTQLAAAKLAAVRLLQDLMASLTDPEAPVGAALREIRLAATAILRTQPMKREPEHTPTPRTPRAATRATAATDAPRAPCAPPESTAAAPEPARAGACQPSALETGRATAPAPLRHQALRPGLGCGGLRPWEPSTRRPPSPTPPAAVSPPCWNQASRPQRHHATSSASLCLTSAPPRSCLSTQRTHTPKPAPRSRPPPARSTPSSVFSVFLCGSQT
jgi:hypothetical protein